MRFRLYLACIEKAPLAEPDAAPRRIGHEVGTAHGLSHMQRKHTMQDNFTSKPFILALHEDHAPTLRELRDEEARRVAGGDGICMMETVTVTPDCAEGMEFSCDD
jgi:hypothetical protein